MADKNSGRLSPPYGALNPIEEEKIGRATDFNTNATDVLKETVLNVFKKDAFGQTGPLKGIVLRVENNPSQPEPNSWISNVFGLEKLPPLKVLKVRIPEIHAALPEPTNYGSNAGESNNVIDMYPSFISANESISNQPVAPGDIVLVDFVNRVNLSQPIYLGPVYQQPSPGAVGTSSPKDNFGKKNENNLQTLPAIGDKPNTEGTKKEENQIPVPIEGQKSPPQTQTFMGELSKPKARLIPIQMDKARTGFAAGKGYDAVRVREDIAENLAEVKRILNALGGVLVSVGTLRPLNADVGAGRVATSFHYTGLAIDLWTHCCAYPDGNPETDEYIIEYDKKNMGSNGPKFIVWARSTQPEGTSIETSFGTHKVENRELMALDTRKSTQRRLSPDILKIRANVINLTRIFEEQGFLRIGGKKEFYTKSAVMTSEAWHFESHKGLQANNTTFKNVLDVIYDDKGEPPYKYGKSIWNGDYFKG